MGLKLTFFGTPETALPFLKMLWEKKAVVSVVTQPDKPAHRGQIVQKSAVKSFVEEKGLPVFQPLDLRDPAWIRRLSETKPEAAVVVAYGRLIPKEVLEIFPLGLYNVHFSLLPALRGAAPIQWAIWRGESKTGVSIFKISETLDTGNILCQSEIPVTKQDDAFTLEEKLVLSALQTLKNALSLIEEGQTQGRPQTGNPSYAPRIKKEDTAIQWSKNSDEVSCQVRALVRLGAWTRLPDGKTLKILKALPTVSPSPSYASPGTVTRIERGNGFVVQCGQGDLTVLQVQMEGKKAMDAWSFLQGARLQLNDQFR